MANTYAKTTWVAGGPPSISASRLNNMESGIFLASAPIVTSLPSSPVDGQECNFLADAANGVLWHLIYRAAETGSYKWYFTGGGVLTAEAAAQVSTNLLTYAGISADPTIVLPLGGDYVIGLGSQMFNDTAGDIAALTAKLGTAAAADAESIVHSSATGGAQSNPAKRYRRNGLASGASIVLNHKVLGGGTANYIRRWLEVAPVRVG